MTANLNVEVSRRSNVLRIPAAAMRFRPSAEMFGALKQEIPAEMRGNSGGGRNPGARTAGGNGRPASAAGALPIAQATTGAGPRGRVASVPSIGTAATTIDSLFGTSPAVETRGRAWVYDSNRLKPVSLRLGISDGTNTEVIAGDALSVGSEVVTSLILPTATTATRPGGTQSPLMGPQRGGPGGPGGPPPGGGRGF
jgi:hypothetical protein